MRVFLVVRKMFLPTEGSKYSNWLFFTPLTVRQFNNSVVLFAPHNNRQHKPRLFYCANGCTGRDVLWKQQSHHTITWSLKHACCCTNSALSNESTRLADRTCKDEVSLTVNLQLKQCRGISVRIIYLLL